MRWDELTSDLFPEAVQQAEGVCLLPLSCIERHAHHLPLATDMFIGREVCNRAARLEPAIVFPIPPPMNAWLVWMTFQRPPAMTERSESIWIVLL